MCPGSQAEPFYSATSLFILWHFPYDGTQNFLKQVVITSFNALTQHNKHLKENENIERKICTTKIEFDNKKESLTNVDKIKRVRNIPNRYKDSNHRILHKNSKNDKKLQNTQNKNRKVNSHSQVLLDKKNYKNYKIKSMKCSNLLNNKLSIEEKAQKYIKMRFINNEASKKKSSKQNKKN